jgi:RNA polymerase sigma factor (sigma-70 family)
MNIEEQKHLVEKHMWLVQKLARQYLTDSVSIPRDDIIQEGNMGLMHAARKFKPELGIQFSTYAGHWVRCYIQRALYKDKTLPIPEWAVFERAKVLRELDGGNQSLDELAKASKYSTATVKWLVDTEFSIRSMDVDINLDGGVTLHDLIPNDVSIETDRMIDSRMQWLDVLEAVSQLPGRQQFVIRKRFIGNGATLQEVGELLNGLSRERVRQIQEDGIQNIRRILNGLPIQPERQLWFPRETSPSSGMVPSTPASSSSASSSPGQRRDNHLEAEADAERLAVYQS